MKEKICPVCAKGRLQKIVSTETVEYGDIQLNVKGLSHSVCGACGAEVTDLNESRANKRLIIEARKTADGLLPGIDVRNHRDRWGINQVEAAKIFGGGKVAFSKYETGDLAQSIPMDRLLRVSIAVPEAMEWLAEYAGVKLRRKFGKAGKKSKFKSALDLKGIEKCKKISAVHGVMPESVSNIEYIELNDESNETKPYSTERLSAA